MYRYIISSKRSYSFSKEEMNRIDSNCIQMIDNFVKSESKFHPYVVEKLKAVTESDRRRYIGKYVFKIKELLDPGIVLDKDWDNLGVRVDVNVLGMIFGDQENYEDEKSIYEKVQDSFYENDDYLGSSLGGLNFYSIQKTNILYDYVPVINDVNRYFKDASNGSIKLYVYGGDFNKGSMRSPKYVPELGFSINYDFELGRCEVTLDKIQSSNYIIQSLLSSMEKQYNTSNLDDAIHIIDDTAKFKIEVQYHKNTDELDIFMNKLNRYIVSNWECLTELHRSPRFYEYTLDVVCFKFDSDDIHRYIESYINKWDDDKNELSIEDITDSSYNYKSIQFQKLAKKFNQIYI